MEYNKENVTKWDEKCCEECYGNVDEKCCGNVRENVTERLTQLHQNESIKYHTATSWLRTRLRSGRRHSKQNLPKWVDKIGMWRHFIWNVIKNLRWILDDIWVTFSVTLKDVQTIVHPTLNVKYPITSITTDDISILFDDKYMVWKQLTIYRSLSFAFTIKFFSFPLLKILTQW
jgi:hypothetical protein